MKPPPTPTADACRERALALLARRAHSRAELERKLLRAGFPPASIRPALDALAAARLVDDRLFAEQLLAEKRETRAWGTARLRLELRKRGVAREIGDELLAGPAADPDAELERACEAASRFLRLRRARRRPPEEPRRERAALGRFLAARGYDAATCRQAMERLGRAAAGDDAADAG
jgi:regulatory protein